MPQLKNFKAIALRIASPDEVKAWSHGEVTKPETVNYRTQRAEKDGLFDERIFGPEKDYECYCGKYRKIRFKGIVCDRCGVEVTHSSVRRERMGHIELATPCTHIWFLRGVPSRVGLMLDVPAKQLEKVVYFTGYIVTQVDENARSRALADAETEFKAKKRQLAKEKETLGATTHRARLEKLERRRQTVVDELHKLRPLQVLDEVTYLQMARQYGEVFEAGVGAETIRKILVGLNLEQMRARLDMDLSEAPQSSHKKILQRLRLIKGFLKNGIRPEWMITTVVPVIPPDLRPMVQLDGGRFATSDVNDLYRRVINRNNRLRRLLELKAPEVIIRNEKRMLQEALDALIDNSARKGKEVRTTTGQKRILKSLADMLKGKQGRFRQNLLGKRVDYSGRSVIVVGPELELDQCGLPKRMALEIFKPFVIHKLIYERAVAPNIKAASRLIEDETDDVWDALESVTRDKYVLLNRAPTLHRLSIQAFRPVLIEGSAIRLHPLVCQAFNADFDGDQMAVHLPVSAEAQREAKDLLLASRNLLKPATGRPIANPTQDVVLGIYWMTHIVENSPGSGQKFGSAGEILLAHAAGLIDIKAKVTLYLNRGSEQDPLTERIKKCVKDTMIETSAGRLIFNNVLPPDVEFKNELMGKKQLQNVAAEIIERLDVRKAWGYLDEIKRLGFRYATRSGISWGMADLITPEGKTEILNSGQKEVDLIQRHYRQGLLTDKERKLKIIETWLQAQDAIAKLVPKALPADGPIYSIFNSGSRGSWGQTTQMAGMKGLVINPASEIIELPVKSSFKEGFNVLEYFISTHGARKGTTDTALKTAVAGYLTRRLVDVAQDIIVREEDCNDTTGFELWRLDSEEMGVAFATRLEGRVLARSVNLDPAGKKAENILKAGTLLVTTLADKIAAAEHIVSIKARSPVACRTRFGICRKCFGYDLARNAPIDIGAAVGIVTAQSIGEPGTQLTMRTFHAGGVAGEADITQGLPRVEELFEVRTPHDKGVLSEVDGVVREIQKKGNVRDIIVEVSGGKKGDVRIYSVPLGRAVRTKEGELVSRGQQLSDGHLDLKALYTLGGREAVQRYVIKEVSGIYTSQGASINEKYIEVIVRKMFARMRVSDPGDTEMLPGEIIERDHYDEANEHASRAKGGKPAKGRELLLGITKVALSSYSFLSAASFQETARVLITAASEGKVDMLRGLKENVIIGKLAPVGTGFRPFAPTVDRAEVEAARAASLKHVAQTLDRKTS